MAKEAQPEVHTITVSIVTPEGEIYNDDRISLASLDTLGGTIGIMANHIPVLTALEISELGLTFEDGEKDSLAINGGFAEFSNNQLTIVADSAEISGDIDVSRAERARDRAKIRIEEAQKVGNVDEMARARIALRRAINRIKVSSSKKL